jgi:hypothetical protein
VILGLILAVLSAAPLRADYLITDADGRSVRTRSYWIQDRKLHLAEGQETLDAYSIRSITAEKLTPDEVEAHDAAVDAFRSLTADLLSREKELVGIQDDTLKKISGFQVGRKNAISKKEKKSLSKGLAAQKEKVEILLADWRKARLPDYSLIRMRDIKELQLIALNASLGQAHRYVLKGDPSSFAYARANMEQYASFDDTFREATPWK